ncbi:MAG: hypothetical protein ACI81T_002710, partial [Bacteroidia bacterium]
MKKCHYLFIFLLYSPGCSNFSKDETSEYASDNYYNLDIPATEQRLEEGRAGNANQSAKTSKGRADKANKLTKTWKRSGESANLGALFIGDTEQLPLKGAQMAVKIDGFRARVLVDYFFFSNESVQMEGT